MSKQPIIYLSV